MSHQEQFFVSVIVPVFNGAEFLADAVQSILAQKHRPLEIIVVDDGSTDNTAEVAAQFQDSVVYVYQTNRKTPAARNCGIKMAQGNVIAFLDADDLWTADKLALQLAHLAENPAPDIVLGYQQRLKRVAVKEGPLQFEEAEEPKANLNLGSGVFRKTVFEKVGLMDEQLIQGDDWDWFMRAREQGVSIVTYPELTLLYRRHENNLTNQIEQGNHYSIKMLKQSLDRRRQANNGKAQSLPKLIDKGGG